MENMFMLKTCKRCGKKTLLKNMRMDKNGVDMVCIDCINKEVSLRNPTPRTLPTKPAKSAPKGPTVKYMCQACQFKFERKVGAQVDKCPYCGKSGTVVPETKLASDKIIDESTDDRYSTPDSFMRRK